MDILTLRVRVVSHCPRCEAFICHEDWCWEAHGKCLSKCRGSVGHVGTCAIHVQGQTHDHGKGLMLLKQLLEFDQLGLPFFARIVVKPLAV